MALFFDTEWFDARLAALGLSRATVATALGLGESELAEIWKDQRELRARDVAILAALLGVETKEIATRAGVSTPVPSASDTTCDAVAQRLTRIEERLSELEALVRKKPA